MAFHPSKRKRHRRESVKVSLMLTPMVDVFVCLLLFLLQSYSATEEVAASDQSFQLPISESRQDPHTALTIKVNREVIVLDNETVLLTASALGQEGLFLEGLYNGLMKKAAKTRYIAASNQTVKFRGDVIIQGDREIPFLLLKKIMYTCSRAEFGNIALAVLQKS